jgi:opacity protein-like surface antigen
MHARVKTMKNLLAAALLVVSFAPAVRAADAVPFIEDNYTKALAQAKSKNLPIFVEAWAPW